MWILNFGCLFILAIACQNVESQTANLSATSQSPDDLLAAANNQSWGMQLFAPNAVVKLGLTPKFVQLYAQNVGGADKPEGGGDAAKKLEGGGGAAQNTTEKPTGGDATGKTAGTTGGVDPSGKPAGRSGVGDDKLEVVRVRSGASYKTDKYWSEVSLSMPRFRQNEKGDWVYHYWGATFGKIWRDTRFGMHRARTLQRHRVDLGAVIDYFPK